MGQACELRWGINEGGALPGASLSLKVFPCVGVFSSYQAVVLISRINMAGEQGDTGDFSEIEKGLSPGGLLGLVT